MVAWQVTCFQLLGNEFRAESISLPAASAVEFQTGERQVAAPGTLADRSIGTKIQPELTLIQRQQIRRDPAVPRFRAIQARFGVVA